MSEEPSATDKLKKGLESSALFRKSAMRWSVALLASLGVSAASVEGVHYLSMQYLVGEQVEKKDDIMRKLKILQQKLSALQAHKEGRSPVGLFFDWARRAGSNPKQWLAENNEPVLKARIAKLKAQLYVDDTVIDLHSRLIYIIASIMAIFAVAPYVFKTTQKLLTQRSELQHKREVVAALQGHDDAIKTLEQLSSMFLDANAELFENLSRVEDIINRMSIGVDVTDNEKEFIHAMFMRAERNQELYKRWLVISEEMSRLMNDSEQSGS